MKKRSRSILDELDTITHERDRLHVLEARANHIINSAINLIEMIRENYDADIALDLERRLINSIRSQDPKKFIRGVKKING
tara:strand:+ start:3714 stop:3956 length:243 start_codon:yes stop_codon:yes gene_type:complete